MRIVPIVFPFAQLAVAAIALVGACTSSGGSTARNDSLADARATTPAAQQADTTAVASLGPVTVSLSGCRLTARQNLQPPAWHADIPLPGRCRFVLGHDGKPQVVNTSRGPTLLVMSSTRLPDGRFCDTRVRAVVIRERSGISISEGEQRIRSCATGPFDTTMFHVLAQSIKVP